MSALCVSCQASTHGLWHQLFQYLQGSPEDLLQKPGPNGAREVGERLSALSGVSGTPITVTPYSSRQFGWGTPWWLQLQCCRNSRSDSAEKEFISLTAVCIYFPWEADTQHCPGGRAAESHSAPEFGWHQCDYWKQQHCGFSQTGWQHWSCAHKDRVERWPLSGALGSHLTLAHSSAPAGEVGTAGRELGQELCEHPEP